LVQSIFVSWITQKIADGFRFNFVQGFDMGHGKVKKWLDFLVISGSLSLSRIL